MSATTLAVTIWTVIAIGGAGFLIIAGALARDALSALRAAREKPPRSGSAQAEEDTR